jgi:hypothetical protein
MIARMERRPAMLRRSSVVLGALALVLAAGFAPGCAKKTEQKSTAVTDSTLSTTTTTTTTTIPDTSHGGPTASTGTMPVAPSPAPDHIEVQHVLIAFQGSIPGNTKVTRTRAEAEKVAQDVLAQARRGGSMDALVQKYTDDQFPGVYDLANDGVTPDQAKGEYARGGMVKGFSDAAFGLSVGNVGIANYDAKNSPFGWHIIKRLR